MDVNWFPGHMAKSTREIEANLAVSDCVLYVLDSRAVRSCFNPNFDRMISVPIVYVLNKADIAPKTVVEGWADKLMSGNNIAVACDGTDSSSRKRLLFAIKTAARGALEKQRARGLNSHIRAIVLGVPNTGKSTIINTLCKKAGLVTGDRAGVTRAARWARVDETLDVLDTPGTLYPKISDRTVGENLAIIGSVKDEVLDVSELAVALIKRLLLIDPQILKARYSREVREGVSGLEDIAAARGFKVRGGQLDVERAASALIDDFRKARLGKIALEV